MVTPKHRHRLLLLGLLTLALAAYFRGLFGGFRFDDYPNIVYNDVMYHLDGSWESWKNASFSSNAGLLSRPVSMFTFALNVSLGGMDPALFKLVNILIHLTSGVLAYLLARILIPTLTGSRVTLSEETRNHLALFAAGAWLLHPLQVSNVLYVVQRMNLLATLFTLAALLCFVGWRQRLVTGTQGAGWWSFMGFSAFSALALLSKENGALIAFFVLVIELTGYRFAAASPAHGRRLRWALGLGAGLPALLATAYVCFNPEWILDGYAGRDFDLATRLLTQARTMWYYLAWTFIPNIHWMGLYHDDIPYSTGFITPWTTLPALLGLAGLLALAWVMRKARPGISFAITWLLAGHVLESTVLALEMVFEHRQYLPMYGLFVGLAAASAGPIQRYPKLGLGLGIAALLALTLLTAQRCWIWGDSIRLSLTTATDHPSSTRSLYDAGWAIIQASKAADSGYQMPAGREYLAQAMQLSPTYIHPVITMVMSYEGEKAVPSQWMAELARRASTMPAYALLPILQVIRAAGEQRLHVSPEEMDELVKAILENSSLDDNARGLVLTNYGNYLIKAANQPQAAISATLAAIGWNPLNPLFHLNAAYLAERLSQPQLALQHLANSEQLDLIGEYHEQIATLRRKLESIPAR